VFPECVLLGPGARDGWSAQLVRRPPTDAARRRPWPTMALPSLQFVRLYEYPLESVSLLVSRVRELNLTV